MIRLALAVLLACLAGAVRAEQLVVALSQEEVAISSNFTGARIVLFGSIEDVPDAPRPEGYDIAVVLRGPQEDVVVRLKERTVGVWVNRASREYREVPTFYAALGSSPLQNVASEFLLRRFEIGLANIGLDRADIQRPAEENPRRDAFARAFLRLKKENALYYESSEAVELLSPTLFKAEVTLPASVPVGLYWADVYLFSGGDMLATQHAVIGIDKSGFEQLVFTLAHQRPFLYGLAAVLTACLIGWLASVLFRRE